MATILALRILHTAIHVTTCQKKSGELKLRTMHAMPAVTRFSRSVEIRSL